MKVFGFDWLGGIGGLSAGLVLFSALPATPNYQLNSYGFGSGGVSNATTSTYALEGTTGELSGSNGASSTAAYSLKPGFTQTQQAQVPKLSAFDNGSNTYYNKLHFVIDTQSNPSDALYALSISTDNFSSDIRYVKSDLTVGSSLVVADYQTYAAFGGASGTNIIGLTPSTTYYVRVKATQGKFTESAFGPVSSATTVGSSVSFSVSTNAVTMGALLPSIVTTGAPAVNITFATNAASGGDIYISGKNIGLLSTKAGVTIPSATGDLSSLQRGYGAQVASVGTTTGTLLRVSPYDGGANNVGVTDTVIRRIITATGPIAGGTGSVVFKAKATATDAAANDYSEVNTMLASGNF
ncbi:MAG TPA: hypothetical protein VF575_03135 [Candidatus Saccharimonadales bacterium]|jgi:hypothetical protein